jgi:predicted MFS family arabinose efflux permease
MEHAVIARMRAPAAPAQSGAGSARAFWLVAFALSVAIMGNNAPSPIYPIFQQRFGLSTGELTLVFAAVVTGVIPSLLILGGASDRVGRRPLLAIALAMALLGAIGFTVADGLGSLLVARALQGVSFGALSGTAVAALVELDPASDHARATLVATVTVVASQAVAPLAGGVLAQYAPDPARLTFFLLAGLLLAALAGLALVPETVEDASVPRSPGGRLLGVPLDIRATFLAASLAVVASFGALGLVAALGPKFVAALLAVHNLAVGGAVVFAMLAASALAQLTTRHWRPRAQLIRGALILAAGLAIILAGVLAGSLAPFLIGITVAGVGQGLTYLGAQSLLDSVVAAEQRASVMSAFFLVLYLAAAFSALAVGLSSGALGLLTATVVVTSILIAVTAASATITTVRVTP